MSAGPDTQTPQYGNGGAASGVAPVVRSVHVGRPCADAFRVFTDRIGDWWPLQVHGLFQAETAGVVFERDRVVERSRSGEEAVWAEVLEWSPPNRVVLAWHPGAPAEEATVVAVDFEGDDDGTRVVLTHSGWERLGDQAEAARASYDGGWVTVVDAYVRLAQAG